MVAAPPVGDLKTAEYLASRVVKTASQISTSKTIA